MWPHLTLVFRFLIIIGLKIKLKVFKTTGKTRSFGNRAFILNWTLSLTPVNIFALYSASDILKGVFQSGKEGRKMLFPPFIRNAKTHKAVLFIVLSYVPLSTFTFFTEQKQSTNSNTYILLYHQNFILWKIPLLLFSEPRMVIAVCTWSLEGMRGRRQSDCTF